MFILLLPSLHPSSCVIVVALKLVLRVMGLSTIIRHYRRDSDNTVIFREYVHIAIFIVDRRS